MQSIFRPLVTFFLSASAFVCLCVGIAFLTITRDLPDYNQLGSYETPLTTRLYSADGKLFHEYATEKRIFIRFEDIPPFVVNTFLAVEDKNFYMHKGLDYLGIIRALGINIVNYFKGKHSPMGGSTITQQVAKNFLLTNEKTLARKMKEAVLAYKIENRYTKQKILELYLNEIYLGSGVYGIASASRHYFNKALDDLTPAEVAYLAALPKAPNAYNVEKHPAAALRRRNWVIHRMLEERIISDAQKNEALSAPLRFHQESPLQKNIVQADYFAEFIRQNLLEKFGEKALYKGGLVVRTTLNSIVQNAAHNALVRGLRVYDRRFGWRGAFRTLPTSNWKQDLSKFPVPKGLSPYHLAIVLKVKKDMVTIGLKGGGEGTITLENMAWARTPTMDPLTKYPSLGAPITSCAQALKVGNVIAVEPLHQDYTLSKISPSYALAQIPQVNGAIVVMDPQTGRILALEGGYSFEMNQFNGAIQAFRQPGSAFKTFVYLAALEKGMTPNTPVLDAEVEIQAGPGQKIWRPINITNKTYGQLPLKDALARSMNLATVWIGQQIGIGPIESVAQRFGICDKLPPGLASVLGTAETNLLKLTTAYATLFQYGRKPTILWIDRIQDRRGETIFRPDHLRCSNCHSFLDRTPPAILNDRPLVTSPKFAYEIVKMLQASVEGGAAKYARVEGHTVAGKTGTTNDYFDAWFVGGTPQLTVGIRVGFDTPRSLGKWQTGLAVAAPIFADFYKSIAHIYPSAPFPVPEEVQTAWIDEVVPSEEDRENIQGAEAVVLESMPIEEGEGIGL